MSTFWAWFYPKVGMASNFFAHASHATLYSWINKASLVLYIVRIMHAVCYATTNLKFGSCTALSSSYLWLKRRNLSLSRSKVGLRLHLCDWGTGVCTLYINDLLPHAPLQPCSYWEYGQVLPSYGIEQHTFLFVLFAPVSCPLRACCSAWHSSSLLDNNCFSSHHNCLHRIMRTKSS
jgi:hypothetical protein